MKNVTTLLLAAGVFSLSASNLLKNTALDSAMKGGPSFDRFVTDKSSGASLKTEIIKRANGKPAVALGSDREKGVTAVVFQASQLKPKIQYYFTFRYLLKNCDEKATLLVRVNLKDAAGKIVKNYWGRVEKFPGIGEQEYLHSFRVDAESASAEIVVYFRGIFDAELYDFHLGTRLPINAKDGNLFWNPSFEKAPLPDFYIVPRLGKENYHGEKPYFKWSREKTLPRTGDYSLHFRSEKEDGSFLINIVNLPYKGKQRYRFSSWSHVVSGTGKNRISASIGFVDSTGKIISYRYPTADTKPGAWCELKDEFYAPEGTVEFRILFWISGKMDVYLDDFFFGPVLPETEERNLKTTSQLLRETSDFTLWQDVSYRKPRKNGIPDNMRTASKIRISCAGNESEPFLITLSPKKKLHDLTLRFSDLRSGSHILPKDAFSYRKVGFIHLANPEYNPTLKGWNADPLLPGVKTDAQPRENLPLYVTLAVPKEQAAGTYCGKVLLLEQEKVLAEIPLEVKVRSFSLPDTPHLRNFFYAWANQPPYRMLDKRPLADVVRDFEKVFREHRMTGNQAKHPPIPKWEISNGNLVITDWSIFDRALTAWYADGMRYFVVPPLNFLGDYYGWFQGNKVIEKPGRSPFCNESWTSHTSLKYVGDFAKQYMEHVRVKYPDARFYAYLFDEPQPSVYEDLSKITETLHRAAPDLNIFITKDVSDSIGGVQTWCVPLAPGFVQLEKQKKHQEKGGEIWYYNWTVCLDEHDYIRTRLYPWQIYAANGNGGLLWNTISMPAGINPWTQMDKTHKIGGATIFYPPIKDSGYGIVPSLRSMQIKESIDDYDYMKILENRIEQYFPGQGRNRVMEILAELLPGLPAPFEFRNNSELLYALRSKLGNEIDDLQNAPVALVTSVPLEQTYTDLTEIKFRIFAPAGSDVKMNGKDHGIVAQNGVMEFDANLTKDGRNEFNIQIIKDGKQKNFMRVYHLKRDPQLTKLEELCKKNQKQTTLLAPIRDFLKKVANSGNYGIHERETAGRLLDKARRTLLKQKLNSIKIFRNELQKALYERAGEADKNGCYERAEYYWRLMEQAASAGMMKTHKVQIIPCVFQKHNGFYLDNGLIRVGFTETAGRIFSFQVRGTECLYAGDYSKALSPFQRMTQKVTPEMVRHPVDYAGFSDEAAMGRWTISLVDWDLDFIELKSDLVTVAVSIVFPDRPFRFKRIMTMKADSPDLEMRYEITNLLPAGMTSDDPAHYQFAWRGRFVPAIGPDGMENDVIQVPIKGDRLPETVFSCKKPVFYERPNFPLIKPQGGVFDSKTGVGFVMTGDQAITHGYIWFNSKGDHEGKNRCYTLEFPRSRYGLKSNEHSSNMPFTVMPGNTFSFSLTLKGLEKVYNENEYHKLTGSL